MKKLFVLGLMTVCLGLFALGCTPKPSTPTTPPAETSATEQPVVDDAEKASEQPATADATKTEEKPVEEKPAQ